MPVRRVFKTTDCRARRIEWQFDGIDFILLSASDLTGDNKNDRSCVLLVRSGGTHVLLTGDIEAAAEQRLRLVLPRFIALISVPHHGSLTSSSHGFLNHVLPQSAVVSAGRGNHFGHPHAAILARYHRRHTRVFNTAIDGGISFLVSQAGITPIVTARDLRKRRWHVDGQTKTTDAIP